jgi:hypothetical protein
MGPTNTMLETNKLFLLLLYKKSNPLIYHSNHHAGKLLETKRLIYYSGCCYLNLNAHKVISPIYFNYSYSTTSENILQHILQSKISTACTDTILGLPQTLGRATDKTD